jgi:phage shock protein A
MLNETPLLRFIALVTFDRDYEKMNLHITSLEKEIALLRQNKQELIDSHTAAAAVLHTLKKEIDSYDGAMASLEARNK